MTAESYISHFSHSRSPLLVESPPICVDDFQYIAEGAEGKQMLEFMFTGCEANVNQRLCGKFNLLYM